MPSQSLSIEFGTESDAADLPVEFKRPTAGVQTIIGAVPTDPTSGTAVQGYDRATVAISSEPTRVPVTDETMATETSDSPPKHFAKAFTGGKLASLLCKRPVDKLIALFPVLSHPGHLNRHAIQLKPDSTDPMGIAKFNRLTNPTEWPLSDYSMWRQWTYRSFSAWQHIGLPANFVDKVEEALTEHQQRPFFDAVREKTLSTQFKPKRHGTTYHSITQLIRSQGQGGADLKEKQPEDDFIKITFCYCTPKGIDFNTPLTLAVQPCCPVDQLAIPIFGLPGNMAQLPELLPKIILYDLDGQQLEISNEINLRPTVGHARAREARFVSFRSYLFRMTFGPCEIMPSCPPGSQVAPYYLIQQGSNHHHCEACAVHVAEVEVSESITLPLSPTYLCADCYNEIFPEGDDGNRTDLYLTELL